jgi:glutathione peroxidase
MNTSKMLKLMLSLLVLFPLKAYSDCPELLQFEAKKLHSSQQINFCERFKDKVLLVVNTASRCGFTPQFKELESLYENYKSQGLEIIGFPSNDFRQEHASEQETASVCFKNYGVSFTMVAPSSIKGPQANGFYQSLITKTGQAPEWNFNKYLISRDTLKMEHFGSSVSPMNSALEATLQRWLAE